MGNTQSDSQLSAWLKSRLKELEWTQKRLAREADVADSTISDLLNGHMALTAEMADKLAGVPELKTTKESLLTLAGIWAETRPSRKRDVAQALFDQLTAGGQDLTIDFMVMVAQRERGRDKG
jgi:plasmid maintenance system antidote protein VapI